MIDPKGSINNKKRMGPRMDPWGTPQVKEDEKWPVLTEKLVFVRYEVKHSRAVPV